MASPKSLSRRAFCTGIAAVPLIGRAQSGPLDARVKIDTERVIGDIDPKIYGNFVEHLGRCIEGGIFDEGSPLSDEDGFRKDVLEATKKLNVTQLRWPGGNFASNYHWKDGIGPRDARPRRLEMAWGTVESNRFGTHEFMKYVRKAGSEPYFCVNLGTGTWEEAQQWVEYVNSAEDTAMTRLRKQNGQADPWKVKYWGLGNEMDGPWQMGHKNAEDYSKYALEAAKLMKWTDPSVSLIAAGSSHYAQGIDWIGWNRTVLTQLRNHIDHLSLHLYVGNQANNYYEFLASSLDLDDRTRVTEGVINGVLSDMPRTKKIYIAWDEWNVWYRARGNKERGRRILEERYNLEDALVVATFLNSFLNHANIVKMANMAQLVNVIAPMFTNEKGMFLQTIYYPLQLFANHNKGQSLSLHVQSPKYESRRFGDVPYLDISSSYDQGALVINAVNRHQDQPLNLELQLQDKSFAGEMTISEVNGPDIKAENDFGVTKVQAANRSTGASGKTARLRLAPHSFTMIRVKTA